MRSVFSHLSGGPFFERAFETLNRGCSMRTPTRDAPFPFSRVLAHFILRVDKLHIKTKITQQTRNFA